MSKKLFLLDGMALAYRAHFALIRSPILTSKGVNTSALYGFTQTLLEILNKQQPTHIAVAFDTDAPTQRHLDFPDYKGTRQAMPEDLSLALPHIRRMLEAFRIPVITCDGYEADDLIGTVACRAAREGFTCYMVTPDKDFGQIVTDKILIYKPGRMGDAAELLGLPEVCARWGIKSPEQVADILALMGDSSDNIPGVPGIGEKTAAKLIAQYGSVENLLAHTAELTGRVRETLETHRESAILSKRLATLICDVPCPVPLDGLELQPRDDEKLKALCVEFEFNAIGRRLFGPDFNAGRGFQSTPAAAAVKAAPGPEQDELSLSAGTRSTGIPPASGPANLRNFTQVSRDYSVAATPKDRAELIAQLRQVPSFAFAVLGTSPDPKAAGLLGIGFSTAPHTGAFVPFPSSPPEARTLLQEFQGVFESDVSEKIGHDLKYHLGVLRWHGVTLRGKLFDTLVAHSLVEPDMRHTLRYVSETFLGRTPLEAPAPQPQIDLAGMEIPSAEAGTSVVEQADIATQLRAIFPLVLQEKKQDQVFYDIEMPLVSVLAGMEGEGIAVNSAALADFSAQLSRELGQLEGTICQLAGTTFNLNSARQLGQILFDVMKICAAPKKTPTGQYATDEQTLTTLAADHEIVRLLLEYRVLSKLKNTYADALPAAIWPATGRIHTTFNQVMTSTGRLNSQDPNLQNIPIRTERGQEIRKAFVPRSPEFLLLSADYSQIELRIIAALSREVGLLEAFRTGTDVHTATAARVFGVFPEMVTPELRRKAKMVNYGIAYGISAFGLAQRLAIPRREAAEIIDQYFRQFAGIRKYMDETIAFARAHGFVQTVTGRRRYLRDIVSSNNTIRSAAERNAINAPIQGTAADMIKIAMARVAGELDRRHLRSRMLLQVHDELLFDLYLPEEAEVRELVHTHMTTAIPLEVPIEVDIGVGRNWLEAH